MERKGEITYEPTDSTWCIVAKIEGRRRTLETDEEGQRWESRGTAFYVYNLDLGQGAVLAIDQSSGLPSLTIDEAGRFIDTTEIQGAIRRSRRRALIKIGAQ